MTEDLEDEMFGKLVVEYLVLSLVVKREEDGYF